MLKSHRIKLHGKIAYFSDFFWKFWKKSKFWVFGIFQKKMFFFDFFSRNFSKEIFFARKKYFSARFFLKCISDLGRIVSARFWNDSDSLKVRKPLGKRYRSTRICQIWSEKTEIGQMHPTGPIGISVIFCSREGLWAAAKIFWVAFSKIRSTEH